MFRPSTLEDVTDEEYRNYISPHNDAVYNYMVEYVMPETAAFYIYAGYSLFPQEEGDLDIFIRSALDVFNVFDENLEIPKFEEIVENTKKILLIRYGLKVKKTKPLSFY